MRLEDYNGYIVEVMTSDGSLEVRWRDLHVDEVTISRTTLAQHPIVENETPEIKMGHELDKANSMAKYRYSGARGLGPHWINIVLLPENYAYTTYSTAGPFPEPSFQADEVSYPLHIGPNYCISLKKNLLCLFYINPNSNADYSIRNQLDIIPISQEIVSEYWGQWRSISTSDRVSIIDKIITQSNDDLINDKIIKHEIFIEQQNALNLCFLINRPKYLINALKRLPNIEISAGGKHQHKVTNTINGKSAPIPQHSKELPPYFAKVLAKELDISYESLLNVAH